MEMEKDRKEKENFMTMLPEQTRAWYEHYYKDKGKYRNELLQNPEVLFQTLAYDASVISALRSLHPNPASARVLDVGSGGESG